MSYRIGKSGGLVVSSLEELKQIRTAGVRSQVVSGETALVKIVQYTKMFNDYRANVLSDGGLYSFPGNAMTSFSSFGFRGAGLVAAAANSPVWSFGAANSKLGSSPLDTTPGAEGQIGDHYAGLVSWNRGTIGLLFKPSQVESDSLGTGKCTLLSVGRTAQSEDFQTEGVCVYLEKNAGGHWCPNVYMAYGRPDPAVMGEPSESDVEEFLGEEVHHVPESFNGEDTAIKMGEWNRLNIMWSFGVGSDTSFLSVYVNGVLAYTTTLSVPAAQFVYLGEQDLHSKFTFGAENMITPQGVDALANFYYGLISDAIVSRWGVSVDHENNLVIGQDSPALNFYNIIGKYRFGDGYADGLTVSQPRVHNVAHHQEGTGWGSGLTWTDLYISGNANLLYETSGYHGEPIYPPPKTPDSWATYFWYEEQESWEKSIPGEHPDLGYVFVKPNDRTAEEGGRWVSTAGPHSWVAYYNSSNGGPKASYSTNFMPDNAWTEAGGDDE